MYKAMELSTYIVSKCIKEDCPISNLQLQKILYYIQKAFLDRGDRAFSDNIEAWQFGPVVPNVYRRHPHESLFDAAGKPPMVGVSADGAVLRPIGAAAVAHLQGG